MLGDLNARTGNTESIKTIRTNGEPTIVMEEN
jgi:hypothetical protein